MARAAYPERMRALVSLAVALLLAGCGGAGPAPEQPPDQAVVGDAEHAQDPRDVSDGQGALPPMPPFDTAEIRLVPPDGEGVTMPVYVADEPAEQRQGLMGVTDLPRDAGMVFVFPEDRDGGFWMKNTLLPLSIAYFRADGTVVSVLAMEPCEADPCPSYPPGAPYRHALEVHQGRFGALGFDDQWRVELPPDLVARVR